MFLNDDIQVYNVKIDIVSWLYFYHYISEICEFEGGNQWKKNSGYF